MTEAYVSDFLLKFRHNKVEPIRTTMAMYSNEERLDPDDKITYYYFTKGTRPDCVIYVQETKMEFRGHDHVIEVVAFAPIAAYTAIRELGGLPVS